MNWNKQGLQFASGADIDAIRREAIEAGFATFVLPATGVNDVRSFFDAVRTTLPLDPPLVGARSWDALSDSLWEGLHAHASHRIGVFWPGAATLAATDASTFATALEVLAEVANLLADPVATCERPKEVIIVVEKS